MLHNLPSGYTELEYIQSSGTQYIDTGFKPNQDSRVIVDAEILSSNTGTDHHIGSVNSNSGYWTMRLRANRSGYAARFGTGALTNVAHAGEVFARHRFDQNKNTVQIDDAEATTLTAATWSSAIALPLCCFCGTSLSGYISMRIYSAQCYDNGTLVRNFIPAKNAAGTAGLYDLVNGAFYTSAGTDAFTAGPEKETPVPTITAARISANPSDGGASMLVAVTVENAESITGTVGGSSVAWTQADGTWSTVAARSVNEAYSLVLQAADAQGASHQLTTTLYYGVLNLIDDRTAADVALVLDLVGKVSTGTATAAELAQWMTDLRGAYNASDLNRVGGAVAYVADRLTAYGYAVTVAPRQGWTPLQIPTTTDMTAYLADVQALRAVLTVPSDTPAVPGDMEQLTWQEANDIERILTVVNSLLTRMAAAWFYSGDLYAGEV